MTVLVTGAAGLLGGHVADLLLADGERPNVLLRPGDDASRLASAGLPVFRADVGDPAALRAALGGVDLVVHCAARTGPWGPAAEYEATNVRAVRTLVGAAVAAGVRRVVHVSSVAVHGNDVGGRADEHAALRPDPDPYSRSKAAGERVVAELVSRGAPVTVVRPGWIYGPRDRSSFARLARLSQAGKLAVVGSGRNRLPLVYVRDAARGVLLAGAAPGAQGRAYLLVNDEPVTQRDYLDAVAAELGAPAPTRQVPYRLALLAGLAAERLWRLASRPGPPPVSRYGLRMLGGENDYCVERARRELGFAPRVGLAEGVRRAVAWYLADTGHDMAPAGAGAPSGARAPSGAGAPS